ncbi:hypothetical protein DJ82_00480 [Halorubrum sp. Ib24]|nr:hypothetical protein DJ82_00480 [Halorubrum sp. Ib24]
MVALSRRRREHGRRETCFPPPVAIRRDRWLPRRRALPPSDESFRLAAARTNGFSTPVPTRGSTKTRVDLLLPAGYTGPDEEPAETLACPDCGVRLFTFPRE